MDFFDFWGWRHRDLVRRLLGDGMDTTTFLIIIIIVLLLAPIFTAHDIRSSLPENLSGWLAVARIG